MRSEWLKSGVGMSVGAIVVASAASSAAAQLLEVAVSNAYTVGGFNVPSGDQSPLAAYGYDASGKFYAAAFGSKGSQDIRSINLSTNPVGLTKLVSRTPWLDWAQNYGPNRNGGNITPGSLLLNPLPIKDENDQVVIPAYGTAIIADGAAVVSEGVSPSITYYPEFSRRIYRLDLFKFSGPNPVTAPVANASNVYTSLVTTAQMQALSGSADYGANTSRQVAFSSDGQSVYFMDTNAANGGLYRVKALGGDLTRLSSETDYNTEPAVVKVEGVDRVYISGGGSTGNSGGVDFIRSTNGQRVIGVEAEKVKTFFEKSVGVDVRAMASDSDGNIYFNNNNTTNSNPGIFRLDPQGRLIKVVSSAQRLAYVQTLGGSSANVNTLRMQVRDTTHTNGSTFNVKQLMYSESGRNVVTGIKLFQPGDFNFDNNVNSADLQGFSNALGLRGSSALAANYVYDLNGNNGVDWKDVKVLQQFLDIPNGDANFDLTLNFTDLDLLAGQYGSTTATWAKGDFTGDDKANFIDLSLLATTWLSLQTAPTLEQLGSRGYSQQFFMDAATAFNVPEPAAFGLLALAGGLMLRRRNRGAIDG